MAPRLDTPLSKALIDAGALDPSALEDAVQEQMIHGGSLDTILLEKGIVDERTLADLLSKAWHTEPVPLDQISKPAPAAVKALPERMALAMRLCPFAVEGTAVHVMCASPLDRPLIEEVSQLLLKPLVPHVVPEVRLWQGLQHAYGTAPDERFAALLTDLQAPAMARRDAYDQSGEGAPEDDMRDVSDPGAARWDLVEAMAHLAAQDTKDGISRVATSYARKFLPFAAMIGVRFFEGASTCHGWLRSGPAEGVAFSNKPFVVTDDCVLDGALKSPSPSLGKPAITPGNAALFGWLGRRRPRTFLVVPITVTGKPVGALVADGGIRARDFTSMSDLVAFAARLGPAFEKLLRSRRASTLSQLPGVGAPPPSSSPQPVRGERDTMHDAVTAPNRALTDERRGAGMDAPAARNDGAAGNADGLQAPKPTTALMASASALGLSSLESPPDGANVWKTDEGAAVDDERPITQSFISPFRDPFREVTQPLPVQRGMGPALDLASDLGVDPNDVPAPPPLPSTPAGQPKPITMNSMPLVELLPPQKDGTSPFARNYVAAPTPAPPAAAPPPAPPPLPPRRPVVVNALSGLSGLDSTAIFQGVDEATATEAWKGALLDAVERGHQGGTVQPEEKARIFLGDDGWEDVRYNEYDLSTGTPSTTGAPTNPIANAGADNGASVDADDDESSGVNADSGALSMPMLGDAHAMATVGDGEPITDEQPQSQLEELVDHLDALDDATVERAKKKLRDLGVEATAALEGRFPGRLRVDPFDPGENVRTPGALGPLVDVVYALGPAGLDVAIPHLDSRYPAHRYAAVLLFALTPDPRGIDLLRARLHDQEPRIRQLAADALAPFVASAKFESVLLSLRERLQSPLLDARRRAVQLLGFFRDVGGVPLLIAQLEAKQSAELAEDARQALRVITLQDFGVRARGWEKWWTKAKKKSRVDWMIEGLSSDDRELRTIAHVELAAIAGDDFGYKPDEQKKNRSKAVGTFANWWAEAQRSPRAG